MTSELKYWYDVLVVGLVWIVSAPESKEMEATFIVPLCLNKLSSEVTVLVQSCQANISV